ncbi:sodium-coupled monocarboxylate transporter 1-like [Macrosteles quadrilineatus]|uniref:sodium-coupled monocarboxylate transporter 1-like n=1 Tax=Macrosteles quadrilineatus TaxID=74068 RepID=UPI0023E2A127|nr:sodium-coupled monocarboxylate transporter 1-like [Macrosteles quadrilineatus]
MALGLVASLVVLPAVLASDLCPQHEHPTFEWLDYVVLAAMLVVSCCIGTFYALFGSKAETSADFLLGGSDMGTIPMAMSLAAGFITAIELLGNPSEMYTYGTQFWMTCVAFVIVVPITSYLYLPVYMKLRLTSCYEYLEMRFNKKIRVIAAALYMLQMVLYTSVAVYAPALALSHVTGLNTYIAVSLVYVVCIFYASQGGMKAVIMTDTFQAAVLVLSIVAIIALGQDLVGGFKHIVDVNYKSGRIEVFELNPNPTVRHSVWSVVIGGTVYWTTMFCSNQASIQKYMSVESIGQARKALWVSCVSLIVIFSINFYTGMIMYAEYSNCDPIRSKVISASDQLLPLFVMNTLGHLHGIPGLFVAGIFAASLGTVASAMNSLAAVTIKDFLHGVCDYTPKEHRGASLSKWISAGFGILSFMLVFVVEQLGSLLEVALSFNGMAGGIMLGLFSLGMFFPWANSRGALIGSSVAMALIVWIGIGTQIAQTRGFEAEVHKPTSLEGCNCNATYIDDPASLDSGEVFVLYQISYLWYSVIGFVVTVVVGLGSSLVYEPQDPCRLHPDLLSPPILSLLQSLPNSVKETIGWPVQSKSSTENMGGSKDISSKQKEGENKGVINLGMVMDENNCPRSNGIETKGVINHGLEMENETL